MAANDTVPAQNVTLGKTLAPAMGYLSTAVEIGVLKAFVDWKVFDHIPESGEISVSELAEKIGGQQELLDRFIPLLIATGHLEAPAIGRVAHTEKSLLYRSDQITSSFLTHIHNIVVGPMAQLPKYLATYGFASPKHASQIPFGFSNGRPDQSEYEILAADPKLNKEFNHFISRVGKVYAMNGVYDFSWMKEQLGNSSPPLDQTRPLLVDVGGSNGLALRDILRDHPWLPVERCAIFDRPSTIAETRASLDPEIKSIKLVEGDAFSSFPAPVHGAFVYQLRRILNDFPDEDVLRCWKAVREASKPDTIVYVVEELLQPRSNAYAVAQDISLMLVGGKRRDVGMHAILAGKAGFKLNRVFPEQRDDCSVLEFIVA